MGRFRGLLAGVIAAAVTASAVPAQGQFFPSGRAPAVTPCVLDKCLGGASQGNTPSQAPSGGSLATGSSSGFGPIASAAFDFYVLALSWSPGFCDTGGDAKAPEQCAAGSGLGFVVHGLWPQNQHGYPSNCDSGSRFPSRAALESTRGLYPDIGLARHEWHTHGTCTGLSPSAYFDAVRRARASVVIPPAFVGTTEPQSILPLDITRSFAAANAGLRPDAMAVTCRQGELQEVRVCLSKDLRGFVSCPEVARDTCRTRPITVTPVR